MTVDHSKTVVVDLSVPTEAFELGDALQPPKGVSLDLVEFVPTGEGPIPYLWVDGDVNGFKQFERQLRDDERVNDVRVVDAEAGRRLVRVAWHRSPNGFLNACLTEEVMLQDGKGTSDYWTFELRFLDRAALKVFRQRCTEGGIPITIYRIMNPGPEDEPNPFDLTDAQLEALLLAFEEGYFDTPREITLEELGEKLGITRQAVSYRLRGGTQRLIAGTLTAQSHLD